MTAHTSAYPGHTSTTGQDASGGPMSSGGAPGSAWGSDRPTWAILARLGGAWWASTPASASAPPGRSAGGWGCAAGAEGPRWWWWWWRRARWWSTDLTHVLTPSARASATPARTALDDVDLLRPCLWAIIRPASGVDLGVPGWPAAEHGCSGLRPLVLYPQGGGKESLLTSARGGMIEGCIQYADWRRPLGWAVAYQVYSATMLRQGSIGTLFGPPGDITWPAPGLHLGLERKGPDSKGFQVSLTFRHFFLKLGHCSAVRGVCT